jgi:hypothetical protein
MPSEPKKNSLMDDKFSGLFDISSAGLKQEAKKQENNLLLTTQSNSTEISMGLQASQPFQM